MKDIKVDWSLSPKGATELVKVALIGQKWRNSKTKQYWDMNGDFGGYYSESSPIDEAKVFAIRPQIAVVADAVEWHKSKGWGLSWASKAKDCITHGNLGFAFADSRNIQLDRKLVCTREQFEAYVKEQEGEKWTHTYDGQKVRWLGDKPDSCEEMAIQYQSGEYGLARVSALKPIKPTISKAEAWDKMISMKRGGISYAFGQVEEKYDIVEVPAND